MTSNVARAAFAALVVGWVEVGVPDRALAWSDKLTTTPSLVQTDFGRFGMQLPLDGEISCGETAIAMSLLWLADNGFTQLAPPHATEAEALRIVRIFTGLAEVNAGGSLVDENWYRFAVSTYLSLRGVGTDQVTWERRIGPDAAWLQSHNRDQSVVNFAIGWYFDEDGVFVRTGQHWLTLLAADPATSVLTINNPYPAAFYAVPNLPDENPQLVPLVPFSGETNPALPPGSYLQLDVPLVNPSDAGRAVLETGYSWTIDPSALPSAGWVPQPFAPEPLHYVYNYTGELEVLAPLVGSGGLYKLGSADLILTNGNDTTGENSVTQGLLASTRSSGTPFGTGAISLTESGGLALRPQGTGGAADLLVASGESQNLAFGHGARLVLERGERDALAVRIGGYDDGKTPNLFRLDAGTLEIRTPPRDLGDRVRVTVAGTGANVPLVTNGIVHPAIVAQQPDALHDGAYLTYGERGLELAAPVSSRWTSITSATDTTVYALDNDQVVPAGETAGVFALQGGRHLLRTRLPSRGPSPGPAVLAIGSGAASREAGMILNGTVVAVDELRFGDSEAVVYTSRSGGWILGDIAQAGALTAFGPGTLLLAGDSRYSGPTAINSGTVVVANTRGTGLGLGPVSVNANGTLIVKGGAADVAGSVFVSQDSRLVLEGGTVGGLEVQYGGYLVDGGLVEGHGTIAGAATVRGAVRAGREIGTLAFLGRAEFQEDAFFTWTLAALDDTPGNEGRLWNALEFRDQVFFGSADVPILGLVDFRGISGPDSGDPFWQMPHRWAFASYSADHPFVTDVELLNGEFAAGSFFVELSDRVSYVVYQPAG